MISAIPAGLFVLLFSSFILATPFAFSQKYFYFLMSKQKGMIVCYSASKITIMPLRFWDRLVVYFFGAQAFNFSLLVLHKMEHLFNFFVRFFVQNLLELFRLFLWLFVFPFSSTVVRKRFHFLQPGIISVWRYENKLLSELLHQSMIKRLWSSKTEI